MTAKPPCCPQCYNVDWYTTFFPYTLYEICQGQTLVQSQQFVVAQIWLVHGQFKYGQSVKTKQQKQKKTKDESPDYMQFTKLNYMLNTYLYNMLTKYWKPSIEILMAAESLIYILVKDPHMAQLQTFHLVYLPQAITLSNVQIKFLTPFGQLLASLVKTCLFIFFQ